jgi:hypothetical protein
LADAAEGRAQYHAEGLVCIAERISPDVQAGMDRLFGGAIFMVLGLSLEKFHEDQAETLPGGGWGARRHCLEG